jgi:hypothetical protein
MNRLASFCESEGNGWSLMSVSLEEANPCADEEKHTQMMSREGKIERKVARGSVCLMTAS